MILVTKIIVVIIIIIIIIIHRSGAAPATSPLAGTTPATALLFSAIRVVGLGYNGRTTWLSRLLSVPTALPEQV